MKPHLIALVGRAGSGKDTVAKLMRDMAVGSGQAFLCLAFADPIKKICREVFQFSDEQLYGPSEERNRPDARYPREDGTCLTPREALQSLGTEWGRRCYPNVWVAHGVKRAQLHMKSGVGVIFTDCRFISEAEAVRAAGGFVCRIHRPEADHVEALHQSEVEMDSAEMRKLVSFDIHNTGSMDELYDSVHSALATLETIS